MLFALLVLVLFVPGLTVPGELVELLGVVDPGVTVPGVPVELPGVTVLDELLDDDPPLEKVLDPRGPAMRSQFPLEEIAADRSKTRA